MARKRWLSTNVSNDRRLAELAERAGPWAALLYTWCIPHAGDDARLSSDPEELLSQVAPVLAMRNLVSVDDAQRFIDVALELGLLQGDGDQLRFPPKSFYAYQSYIGEERRSAAPAQPHLLNGAAADHSISQQNAEDRSGPPQNRAFVNSSSSLTSSLETNPPDPPLAPPQRNKAPAAPDRTLTGMDLWIETTVEARRPGFHDDEPDRTKKQLHGMWATARAGGWAQREFQDVVERAVMDTKDALYTGKLHRNDEGEQKGWPLCISKIRDQLPQRRRANGARAGPGPPAPPDAGDPSTSRPVQTEESDQPA